MRVSLRGPMWLVIALLQLAPTSAAEPRFAVPPASTAGVAIDEISDATRSQLLVVDDLLAAQRWSEAARLIVTVVDESGTRMVPQGVAEQGFQRYISLREYIASALLRLPDSMLPVLRSYEQLVGPVAQARYAAARAEVDREKLHAVASEFGASQAGTLARNLLAELALERADFVSARHGWQSLRSIPANRLPAALTPAILNARLVLTSILQGDRDRGTAELEEFDRQFPETEGAIAGQRGPLAAILRKLLADAAHWPARPVTPPLFSAPQSGTLTAAWQVKLPMDMAPAPRPPIQPADLAAPTAAITPPASVSPPAVVGTRVFLATDHQVFAFELDTGRPMAGTSPEGILFSDPALQADHSLRRLGTPWIQLYAHEQVLLARMGTPVTITASDSPTVSAPSQLLGFDLSTFKINFRVAAPPGGWKFEGSPVTDGEQVYCCLRRSTARPELHVAAFDLATGEPVWRTFVAAAATPGRGLIDEVTHASVVLHQGQLFCSSQTGAIACLETDGSLNWVTTYRRDDAEMTPTTWNRYRLASPCHLWEDAIYVLPQDAVGGFSLEVSTGALLWSVPVDADEFDAWQITALTADEMIAGGRRLWWFDRRTGALGRTVAENPFPSSMIDGGIGCGRGVLDGDVIFWPARTDRVVVHRRSLQDGRQVAPPWTLAPPLTDSVDLYLSPGLLLARSAGELVALRPNAQEK